MFILQGVVEVVTSLKQLPIMEDSNNNEEDPFSETALFERLKSPNQCSGYRVKSPYYHSDTNNTASFSLELLSPYSICVSMIVCVEYWFLCFCWLSMNYYWNLNFGNG